MKSNGKVLVDHELLAKVLKAFETDDWQKKLQSAIDVRAVLEQQDQDVKQPPGEVVVTTNQQGQCVAVTRQDDEGRTLSVIWEVRLQRNQHPLSDEFLRKLHHEDEFGLFCDYDEFEQITRAVEQAHNIGATK